MPRSVQIPSVRLVYFKTGIPEWFPTTYLPQPLAPLVRRYYQAHKPIPLTKYRFAAGVYIDAAGIASMDTVRVRVSRGYVVECPKDHADFLAATLLGPDGRADVEVADTRITFLACSFSRAAVWTDDLGEIAELLKAHGADAAAVRLDRQARGVAGGYLHVPGWQSREA